jgi:hypothetical protein
LSLHIGKRLIAWRGTSNGYKRRFEKITKNNKQRRLLCGDEKEKNMYRGEKKACGREGWFQDREWEVKGTDASPYAARGASLPEATKDLRWQYRRISRKLLCLAFQS